MCGSSPRRGVAPTVLTLTAGGSTLDRVHRALVAKRASVSREEVAAGLDRGDIGLVSGSRAFIHRPVPDETDIELPVLLENDRIIIIDKPAGIATTPQGSYVARSVLVQARRQFGDSIVCAHRLDRATSGALLLVRDARLRAAYHCLFSSRAVSKLYEFIAAASTAVPRTYSSRLERRGRRVVEVDGKINAVTDLALIETSGPWGRYEARPRTGQMHQIRAHAAALGIPILSDTLYGSGDGFPDRIALSAQSISFTDPVDGETVTAVSRQRLTLPSAR